MTTSKACKCGCGETVKGKRVFVNKEHQLAWMHAGGASEMNALMPDDARVLGGQIAGKHAAETGRLQEAGKLGAQRSREIAEAFRKSQDE